jgi:hypothetical protein
LKLGGRDYGNGHAQSRRDGLLGNHEPRLVREGDELRAVAYVQLAQRPADVPNERRWMMSDGLAPLVHYIEAHLHQEACCRAGEPWPGEEAPGSHGRERECATCGGVGS